MLLLTQGKVYHEYYSGMYLSGTSTKNWTVNGLNFSNGDQTNFWGPVNEYISAKIIFFLRSQYSGTINGAADDGIDLWVNDALNFNHFWGSANVIDNSNFNLVKDKLYSWYSEWCQGPGAFSYTLYMIYSGVSNAAISNSNLYLPNLVGASPYNIKIVDSICGDKFRTGTEAWDDGNKINGDGWSSIWSTESGWTWSGGSHLNKDICNEICGDGARFNTITSYWDDGNKNNEDGWSNTCSVENGFSWSGGSSTSKDKWTITSIQANAIFVAQSLSIIWVWANLLSSLLNMSSLTGVFTIINQFQLLFLIVVSRAYLSEGVLELIIGMKIVLLNFNFTFIDEIRLTDSKMYSSLSYDQPNKHLYDIGVIQ